MRPGRYFSIDHKLVRRSTVVTEMKAVRSMVTRGIISTSCSDATNSSSGGVTEVRSDCGRDIIEQWQTVRPSSIC